MAAGGLVLLAWLALAAWSRSPYAEWLDHGEIQHIAAPAAIRLAVYTLGWALMIISMMLPSIVLVLARSLENRQVTLRSVAPVIVTYMAVWTVFGVLSYVGDSILHEVVEERPALASLIAPGIVFLAGIYQLTPMKRVCLSKCCSDGAAFASLAQTGRPNPWRVGLRYGAFCVGSCWGLMLLMVAMGGVNFVGMLVLGAISAAERLDNHGANLARALGILLIVFSLALALT
jgi:predicted metal-binding membrane protein